MSIHVNSSIEFGEDSKVLLFFPCLSCGQRVFGNYCSNCGKKVTALSKLDFIRVDLTLAAVILEKALADIVESIYSKELEEGASEEEIVKRIRERFAVPEKFKPREKR